LLDGCSAIHAAQRAATYGFNSSFRSSFKTSFLKSCMDRSGDETLCTCVEAKLEAANSDKQLMELTIDTKAAAKVVGDDVRACKASS
jgi:hypothetical protein